MKHKSLKTDALFSQIEHKYVFHVHKNDLKHTAKTEHHGNWLSHPPWLISCGAEYSVCNGPMVPFGLSSRFAVIIK